MADSSALISLFFPTDNNHKIAVKTAEHLDEYNTTIITPGDIFTETMNVIGKKFGHNLAISTGNLILDSNLFIMEEINDQIRKASFKKFKTEVNSTSFTDCIVMAFADHFETKDIFGFDEIFAKNGYTRLGLD